MIAYIDLSLRNTEQGYIDSLRLIQSETDISSALIGAAIDETFEAFRTEEYPLDIVHDILSDIEGVAGAAGYDCFASEGFYYVGTHADLNEWWNDHAG